MRNNSVITAIGLVIIVVITDAEVTRNDFRGEHGIILTLPELLVRQLIGFGRRLTITLRNHIVMEHVLIKGPAFRLHEPT